MEDEQNTEKRLESQKKLIGSKKKQKNKDIFYV